MAFKGLRNIKPFICLLFYAFLVMALWRSLPDILERRYIQERFFVLASLHIFDGARAALSGLLPLVLGSAFLAGGFLIFLAFAKKRRAGTFASEKSRSFFQALFKIRYPSILAAVIFLPCAGILLTAKPQSQDNIILILIDTLRADHVGCYGYDRPVTPRIDALSRSSLLYTHVYAPSSWTKTSVASLMTGVYPYRHNVFYEYGDYSMLPESSTTIAEVLKNSGFRTVGISANPYIIPEYGFSQGFSFFTGNIFWNQNSTRAVTEMSLRFIKSQRSLKSTFLYIHYLDPHDPYASTEPCEPVAPAYVPERKTIRNGLAFEISGEHAIREKLRRGVLPKPDRLSKEDKEYLISLYDCEIKRVDEGIGRILDTLKETGAMDNTWVIITSDHGEEFLEHGMLRHGYQLFEESVKIPLIIYAPGRAPSASRLDSPVEYMDLFPTILSFLNVSYHGEIDGRILPPFNRSYSEEDSIILGMTRFRQQDKAFLRRGATKIIKDFKTGHVSIFNLDEDPAECDGTAGLPSHEIRDAEDCLMKMIEQSTTEMPSPEFKAPENPSLKQRLRTLGYLE